MWEWYDEFEGGECECGDTTWTEWRDCGHGLEKASGYLLLAGNEMEGWKFENAGSWRWKV